MKHSKGNFPLLELLQVTLQTYQPVKQSLQHTKQLQLPPSLQPPLEEEELYQYKYVQVQLLRSDY